MAKDFNQPQVVENYDEHIRKLIPGYEVMHSQVNALLRTYLPEEAHILVVGCGTGYELRYLAAEFPRWTFTAIDPAENMLNKAKQLLESAGYAERVDFILGDTSILEDSTSYKPMFKFDAALAILVSHFISKTNKYRFFKDIFNVLKPAGLCLSYDLMHLEHERDIETLKYLAQSTGLSEQQSQVMCERLQNDFHLIHFSEMRDIYKAVGFEQVRIFTQMFAYYGFFAMKI